MYIKDEYLILEKLQKTIDSGEDLILHPSKTLHIIIAIVSFLAAFWILLTIPNSILLSLILWSITYWNAGCFFSRVGLLIFNKKGLTIYNPFGINEIPWPEIEGAHYAYAKPSYYLALDLKRDGQVELSRYDYKNVSGQTLIKLIGRNSYSSTSNESVSGQSS